MEAINMSGKKGSLLERFNRKVIKNLENKCWGWDGFVDKAGYGRLNLGPRGADVGYAHRISYEFSKGAIPQGLELDHLCRNRKCSNPDHLEAVTHKVNVLRGVAPNMLVHNSDHCERGHPRTKENIYWVKNRPGVWQCRECKRYRRWLNTRKFVDLPSLVSEKDLRKVILQAARLFGWKAYGINRSDLAVLVNEDSVGFPDLVLAKAGEQVILAELKSEKGQMTKEQTEWHEILKRCPGCRAFIWRPSDFDFIVEVLQGRSFQK